MKPIFFQCSVACMLTMVPLLIAAQKIDLQMVGSSGGTIQTSAGMLDFTLGELCIKSYIEGNTYLGEGFQQAWLEAAMTTDIYETNRVVNISLLVYPNPTANLLTIESDYDIDVQLYDILGRPACNKMTINGKAQLDLSPLPVGLYLLHSFDTRGKLIGTLKVQHVE